MGKKFLLVSLWFALLIWLVGTIHLEATNNDDDDTLHDVVYFYDVLCEDCQALERDGVIEAIEDQGINVLSYDATEKSRLFSQFVNAYDTRASVPILFAGDEVYTGQDAIINGMESGAILTSAEEPLRPLGEGIVLEGFSGLLTVIVAGLIDGVNPCAIAMLLMFVSLISFVKNRRIMVLVSIAYIAGVFVTYLAVGLGVLHFLSSAFIQTLIAEFSLILYSVFAFLALLFFIVTFYDFLVTKNEKYEKVKNQLPQFVKNLNKRIMESLTTILKDEDASFLRKFNLFLIPFLVGIIIGFTEAACTGQIYFFVLALIETGATGTGTFYLIIFNIMFIMPLVIIALIAIMNRNVMAVSNFVREHLAIIKLITALFFLAMVILFIYLAFGHELPNLFERWLPYAT